LGIHETVGQNKEHSCVIAHRVPGEVFRDLLVADIPEVLNICADQLTEGDLEKS
jgi:hypothetical protein